ncbi:MAG: VWA domain-containing protein [Lachnospiraceae bacterium]|nr:VWA domain-containing protein [Lachnospiraceae bacterium]
MKKAKQLFCILTALFLLISSAPAVHAATQENEDEDKILAPYFVVQGSSSCIERFPLRATSVNAAINGMIAEIFVTQTYTNEGEEPISARYVFPASSGVSVHGMTMEIGNQLVTAQIKEKEEAKQEFEQAKRQGKSASLLEQQRPNVFTMDVANIMPGDVAKIELHYTQMITPKDGVYEFIFPTVVGPRYAEPGEDKETESGSSWIRSPYLPKGETPLGSYDITVNLDAGVPVTELSCKSHEINVSKNGDSKARITLADQEDYAGNRDFILKYRLTGESLQTGLVLTAGTAAGEGSSSKTASAGQSAPPEENFFMVTVQPPERYVPEDIPPREYIFVLDVSGSMNGYPLDTAKALIRNLVSGLKESDRFNLVLFSGSSEQMADTSLPATRDNIRKAIDLVDSQDGYGGTSLSPALETAVAIPSDEGFARSIVIITDGYISGEQNVFEIVNQNMDSASFFSFGIGCSVNDYLIKGIANAGLGESFLVTDEADAASTAQSFCTYVKTPLLTEIQVDFGDFEAYDTEPSVPSTLFSRKPIVLFGKWKGEPRGTIRITGKTGNQDYEQEIEVTPAAVTTQSDAIRYLWARTKLERLMDYGFSKDDPSVKEEVTEIGLAYSLMTPYTSFVAVVDTVRNPEGKSRDVDQPNPLPLHVSNLAVGGGYAAYSEPESLIVIILAAGALLPGLLRKRKQMRQNGGENAV